MIKAKGNAVKLFTLILVFVFLVFTANFFGWAFDIARWLIGGVMILLGITFIVEGARKGLFSAKTGAERVADITHIITLSVGVLSTMIGLLLLIGITTPKLNFVAGLITLAASVIAPIEFLVVN